MAGAVTMEVAAMIRAAVPGDAPALGDWLSQDEGGAMFPLAILDAGGLAGPGEALAPRAMHGWLAPDDRGGIGGFVGLDGGGHLMAVWPAGDWQALRPALAGRRIAAVIGRGDQAAAALRGLGLGDAPRRHDSTEPGFALDLGALILPDGAGDRLIPLAGAPRDLVVDWRAAYLTELFDVRGAEARARATVDIDRWLAADSHRVLMRADEPVAMSGFNARLRRVVQVGGVWTPPTRRGQGLARRVVALHLAEARAAGVARAVLFAANEPAAAAYRALGFARTGTMSVIELAEPATVPPWH